MSHPAVTPKNSASPDESVLPPPSDARFSPVTRFALLAGFWLLVALAFATQLYALDVMPWGSALALGLLDWGPWILFSPLVFWLARRIPIHPQTWRRALPAHLLLSAVVVLLMGALTTALVPHREVFFERKTSQHEEASPPMFHPPDSFWARVLGGTRVAIPVYWMLVAGAQAVAQYRRGLERERRALRAEAHLAEARLLALQGQLNPHFLFNTLNTITELVYANPKGAEAMIVALSDLLRAALAAQQRREVALRDEVAFVRHYSGIQKVRFSDRLDVRYEIGPAALDAAVPTLLLQPLVENAILHGMGTGSTPITVFVRARVEGGRLFLEVADTGGAGATAPDEAGRALLFQEGVGLDNTRARLAALYGAAHHFALVRAIEGGVAVRIEIPARSLSA